MKRSRKRVWPAVYCLTYAFVYAGWWFHRCREPAILLYSFKYLVFLVVMAVPFLLPPAVRQLDRSLGRKRFRYGAAAVMIVLAGSYVIAAVRYYYSQEHLFDPFVQVSPPRIPSAPAERAPRTVRVLALGGSTTRGAELTAENRYPHVLKKRLEERYPAVRIDMLNGAMEWYTTRHSLINYVTYYRDWHPDIVLIMHGINDLCRSFSPTEFAVGEYDPLWCHFYGPAIQGARPPTFEQYLRRRYLADIFHSWYSSLRFMERDYSLDRYVSRPMFERHLRRLVHDVQMDGAVPVLITEPSFYREGMSAEQEAALWFSSMFCDTKTGFLQREYPSSRSLAGAMNAYADVVREVADGEGAVLVDAALQMPRDLRHFRDDVHHTPEGARVLAEIMAEKLIESGVIETKGHH